MDHVLKFINIFLLSIVGMLLLTGVMVLVQGSKVDFKAADWWAALSAVATVGTFYVAWLVYRKVPDWLAPKLKTKQFEFADELIEDFCNLQQEALHLHTDFTLYFNSTPESNHTFYNVQVDIGHKMDKYIKNTILMSTKMERIVLWGLNPKNKQVFDDVIQNHTKLYGSYLIGRSYKMTNPSVQSDELLDINEKMLVIYKNVVESHKNIIKPYNELFEK